MLLELGATNSFLDSFYVLAVSTNASNQRDMTHRNGCPLFVGALSLRSNNIKPIWVVVDLRLDNRVPALPISVEVHHRAHRSVNGELLPVDPKTRDLRVEI